MENYEVKIHSGDEWYVYIYHNQKIIKKFYKGLKNAPDDDERMLRAKALKMVIENDLKAGWIPKKNKTALPSPYQFNLTVFEAYTKGKELFEHPLGAFVFQTKVQKYQDSREKRRLCIAYVSPSKRSVGER